MAGTGVAEATATDLAANDVAAAELEPARRFEWSRLVAGVGILVAAVAVAATVVLLLRSEAPAAPAVRIDPAKLLLVQPDHEAANVPLNAPIVVQAPSARLWGVTVLDPAGHSVPGTISPDGHRWQSSSLLAPDTRYRVIAQASLPRGLLDRDLVGRRTSFTTLRPTALLSPTITPAEAQTVGVGMPIVLRFKAPVANRAAVAQALSVTPSIPIEGAWRWVNPREVHYRPREYWPAGEHVTMVAKFAGLDAGNGVWGDADRTLHFTVGDAHVTTVDTVAHTMTVTNNGAPVRTVPMSAGRTKYPTMGGAHIVLYKSYDVLMDSQTVGIPRNSPDGYYEHVYWDVAISNGGEYVHAAPWSVGAQGRSNVSHGCVNLSPSDATWFYGFSQPGDVVQVVGSPRPPSDDAGTVDWKLPWEQWIAPQ
jgi:lipoprotein-anchoring transpeptidase ErfK/SrfK